jgi:molybdopterin-guanine dinucleotide biosynthesis protein B
MVAVVGRKNSGKTTLVVRLVAELGRRGHRVMTIKHGHHTFNIDPSTTDTYRHYYEGNAERVAMVAPDKFALVVRSAEVLGPEAVAERYLSDADVVVCEGFRDSALPRVEVFREAAHPAPYYEPGHPAAAHYLAVITDRTDDAPAPGAVAAAGPLAGVAVLSFADERWLDDLASLVERVVMAGAC